MRPFRLAALLVLAAVCAPAPARAEAPFYRVFRGFKLPGIPAEAFPSELATKFIPQTPAAMVPHSLVGYVPALPPLEKPAFVPDEVAIVVYGSGAAYDAGRDDPVRKAYGALHWDYFEDPSKGGRTQSQTARPLARVLEPEVPVDVLGTWPDWQTGYTQVFVGLRHPDVPKEEFLGLLTDHVVEVREAFGPRGLDGYIAVGNHETEIAWLHWTSRSKASEAFKSEVGYKVAEGAERILVPLMFADGEPFSGSIDYGKAVSLRFKPTFVRP